VVSKLFYVCLSLEKLVNGKHFPGKCFPLILGRKHFLEVVKNLKMSYYLLVISNLVLKLLIAMYIFFEYFFQFHPLEYDFYINFGPHFYNCYFLFLYYFLIKIFYLSNLILILFIVTYFI
jgi:hypothetical protein